MPHWLQRQIMKAFLARNRRQVLLLNDCWFLYLEKQGKRTS
ncbi:cortex morphogenetic protein CmpA [Aneurinibacillus sp. Ricciae_BoGa-3]|nr:cortex morphogenetic protein CmpA [Aneurinibacillus sp. Ricciae_BoGa-3]WCK54995.1 cortex morphogenetic protein CmpA [Aneurinibacillus sp. Ricciae_BoGa-3]